MLASFLGPLYDKFPNPHFVLGAGVALAGIGTICVPFSTSVYFLAFIVMLQGVGMAVCDVGCNVLLIYLWGSDVGPWMQLMHFCFGVGAFVAPLLMRMMETIVLHGQAESNIDSAGTYDGAFYIMGILNVAVAAVVAALKAPKRRDGSHGTPSSESTQAPPLIAFAGSTETKSASAVNDEAALQSSVERTEIDVAPLNSCEAGGVLSSGSRHCEPAGTQSLSASTAIVEPASSVNRGIVDAALPVKDLHRETWVVASIIAGLLFLYVGMETGFGAFITSYAVVYLRRTEAEGQLLASGYWGAIMVGRLIAVPLSMRVKPVVNLGATMTGCIAASVVLLAGQNSIGAVWVGSILFGLFMASVFPLAISVAESFFPVEGKHATLFVIGAATGEMLLPFIVSSLFGPGLDQLENDPLPSEHSGSGIDAPGSPVVLMWVMGVAAIINMGVWWLARKRGNVLHSRLASASQSKQAQHASSSLVINPVQSS